MHLRAGRTGDLGARPQLRGGGERRVRRALSRTMLPRITPFLASTSGTCRAGLAGAAGGVSADFGESCCGLFRPLQEGVHGCIVERGTEDCIYPLKVAASRLVASRKNARRIIQPN